MENVLFYWNRFQRSSNIDNVPLGSPMQRTTVRSSIETSTMFHCMFNETWSCFFCSSMKHQYISFKSSETWFLLHCCPMKHVCDSLKVKKHYHCFTFASMKHHHVSLQSNETSSPLHWHTMKHIYMFLLRKWKITYVYHMYQWYINVCLLKVMKHDLGFIIVKCLYIFSILMKRYWYFSCFQRLFLCK